MTNKQLTVIKDLSENIGKPIGQAMRDAGYSESTSKTPARLTNTKAWKDIMEEYFPDEMLAQVAYEGLHATKIHSSPTEPDREIHDYLSIHKFLETILKLKGKYNISNQIDTESLKVSWLEGTPLELKEKYGIGITDEQLDRVVQE